MAIELVISSVLFENRDSYSIVDIWIIHVTYRKLKFKISESFQFSCSQL